MSEYFETFDDNGDRAGLVERATVHRHGLWHRAVHVWVFRSDGRLYVQRRAEDKDVAPGCWDVSVGEHLQPGEDYVDAAHRGLREELGITGVELAAVGAEHAVCNDRPDLGIRDREIQRVFRICHDGPVHPAAAEIAELRLWTPEALRERVGRAPGAFTPGLRTDLAELARAGAV